jgi:putative transposase
MARPLRLEYPGAVYHLTSRGDRREAIFRDDDDRQAFLDVLGLGLARFGASALAYCLMGNHYHLVVQTHRGGLSQLMRHVNGVYTQAFNRRHGLVGHLFQGRYKAIVCDSDRYLMALSRYVERNPVAAGLVAAPGDWAWSSFNAHTGQVAVPDWLDTAQLQAFMLERAPRDGAERAQAQRLYAEAAGGGGADHATAEVDAASVAASIWAEGLRQQVYLGDVDFVARVQALAEGQGARFDQAQVPRAQRASPLTLADWLQRCASREEALLRAHRESGLTMTAMAKTLGLSVTRIGRLIARAEAAQR